MFETIEVQEKFTPNAKAMVLNKTIEEACNEIPDASVRMIISSPPYNIGKSYERATDLETYLGWQTEVIERLVEKLDENGSICWQVGNYIKDKEVFPLDIYFYPIFKKLGLKLRNRIIWHFGHGLHAKTRFSGRYETLLWFTKGDDYVFNLDAVRVPSKYPGKRHYKGEKKGQPSGNPLGKNPSDVWEIIAQEWEKGMIDIPNVKANHPEKTEHPCQFPVELVERCVLALTDEDDLILDPFGGVGTTLLAGIRRKRRVICVDKEADYCRIAKQRLEMLLSGQLKVREIGTQVFKPKGTEKVSQVPIEWQQEKRA